MIEDVVRDNIRKIVKAYATAHGTTVVNISRKFYGNHGFLDAFFAGEKSMSLRKLEAMYKELIDTWPEGGKWPLCRVIVFNPPPKKPKAEKIVHKDTAAA